MVVKVVFLTVVLAVIWMNQSGSAVGVEQVISSSKDRQISQLSLANPRQEIESEGECVLKLTSKLASLSEEMSLALCNLGSCFAKLNHFIQSQLNIAKLVEYVMAWQQDVEYVECRLEDFGQELVTRQTNIKKLAMLPSHALDLVAMADVISSELSDLFLDISCLDRKIESNFFRLDHIIGNTENSLTEVILVISIAEELLIAHTDFTFTIQREMSLLDHLQTTSTSIARTELVTISNINQSIDELSRLLNYQAAQLRRTNDLLQSLIRKIGTLTVVENSLQRVENSLNHKDQQIASLIQQISKIRTTQSDTNDLISSISKTLGAALFLSESRVTKFESYRSALLMSQSISPLVLEHTLNLLVQFETIQQIADQYSIPRADSPFSTLDEIGALTQNVQAFIQTINVPPSSSLQVEVDMLIRSNFALLQNIDGTHAMLQGLGLQTGGQLPQRMGYLKTALESLVELKQNNTISEEVKNKTREVHQQVEELSASMMSLIMKISNISGRIRSIKEVISFLSNRIQVVPSVTSKAEQVLETIPSQFADIREHNLLVSAAINSINVSIINETITQFQATAIALETGEEIVNSILNLLDQVSLPVQFSNDSVLTLNPESAVLASPMTTSSSEFHSLSFTLRKVDLDDCIIAQLTEIWQLNMDHYINVTIGVINNTLMASFVFNHPIGGMESVTIVISGSAVIPGRPFLIEISRTDRNVHLLLQDIETESVHCVSSSISSMMASFFRTGASSRKTSISLGGAPSSIQNMPFLGIGNFTGCLSEILLNGENLELWSLMVSMQIDPPTLEPCSSSEITLRELRISCDGSEYAQAAILHGDLLPLEFSFSSFLPNGVLMYAFNKGMSIQISLQYGHIVVKIVSNGAQMILISLQTYTNGANHLFSLSLSNSSLSLVLKTSLEETTMAMESELVLNLTSIFLCGAPEGLVNETGPISNFTGCAALSSRIVLDPLPVSCTSSVQQKTCSYCLNQAVYSASFYGTSYAIFTPVTVKDRFDFGFSFITSFPSGLLLHSGNSSRGLWFDVVMVAGQLQLLFGSPFGSLSLPARTPPLNDLTRHSITFIVNKGSSIDIIVDGSSVGSFPFGSFFPSGRLTPILSVGGIDPALEELIVLPGVTTEGFKGCIDHLHVLGQLFDFSMSEKAEQVNFKSRDENLIQNIDAFRFDGEGYAQYDLGRFEANFKLGLQLRTLVSSALLLYMEGAFALQIVNGKANVIIAGDEIMVPIVTIVSNSSSDISDGLWHSVVVRKSGSHVQLITDEHPTAETNEAATQTIQTDLDLFIGGVPNSRNVSLPGVIREGFRGEMRMAYLAHSVRSNGEQYSTLEMT